MHTITKSQVVGKAVKDLPKDILKIIYNGSHKTHDIWNKSPVCNIDFLSRCTLRYANSYGATYKIDPTHALRIISNKNRHFYLSSYEKLLDLVIEDYQELRLQEQPMSDIPEYLDRKPQIGDYVERTKRYDNKMDVGSIWKVTYAGIGYIRVTDNRGNWEEKYFKIINPDHPSHPNYQEPKLEIKPGTHWERLERFSNKSPAGEIITVASISNDNRVGWYGPLGHVTRASSEFLEHFKPRPDLDITEALHTTNTSEFNIGDLICYNQEARNELGYAKGTLPNEIIGTVTKVLDRTRLKSSPLLEYKDIQGTELNIDAGWVTKYVATPAKPKPTKSTKPKPVAQPEPIIPTPIKETFMSKIKASASATVDQNKQALVIASKMEAGRIINKQVLKQLTPHLPFFLQGYAKSPFAPFVAANLVAMVANHTGNSKLTKVSDLMLLGAADSGVAAFNLDKIVDDILSNIKLPAGVLDDSDDE